MSEQIGERLRGVMESVGGRLSATSREGVEDWIEHFEWTLAIDILADALDTENVALTATESRALRSIVIDIGEASDRYSYLWTD